MTTNVGMISEQFCIPEVYAFRCNQTQSFCIVYFTYTQNVISTYQLKLEQSLQAYFTQVNIVCSDLLRAWPFTGVKCEQVILTCP